MNETCKYLAQLDVLLACVNSTCRTLNVREELSIDIRDAASKLGGNVEQFDSSLNNEPYQSELVLFKEYGND